MPGPIRRSVHIGMEVVAAGTSAKRRWRNNSGRKWYIEAVSLVPDAAVTGHADNFTVLSLQRGAAEGSLAAITTTWSTDTDVDGSLTAGQEVNLTPTEGTARVIVPGDILAFTKADAGTGVAFSGSLTIELTEITGS